MSKRILAFRTQCYPHGGPATRRFESFCRYLDEAGHRVTAVGVSPTEPEMVGRHHLDPGCSFEVIGVKAPVPSRIRRRVESAITRRFFPGCTLNLSYRRAVHRVIRRLLEERQFDCVLTTSPPLGSLVVAYRISRAFSIPWVADLRDLPDEHDLQREEMGVRRGVDIVSKACSTAAHVITVSEPLAERLRCCYGLQQPIAVIYNGFDESVMQAIRVPTVGEEFSITYCGSGGYGRDIGLLMEALNLLGRRGVDLSGVGVKIYGVPDPRGIHAEEWIDSGFIKFYGRVPHVKALEAQANSGVVVSLASPAGKGIMTSKIFECAVLGRPVLSMPAARDVLDEFIERSKIGLASSDAGEIATFLEKHVRSWRASGELPSCAADKEFLMGFSRRAQAAKLINMIDGL